MDIALAIHEYNPASQYLLSHSNATEYSDIIEWRSKDIPKPTEAQLKTCWSACCDRQAALNKEAAAEEEALKKELPNSPALRALAKRAGINVVDILKNPASAAAQGKKP